MADYTVTYTQAPLEMLEQEICRIGNEQFLLKGYPSDYWQGVMDGISHSIAELLKITTIADRLKTESGKETSPCQNSSTGTN